MSANSHPPRSPVESVNVEMNMIPARGHAYRLVVTGIRRMTVYRQRKLPVAGPIFVFALALFVSPLAAQQQAQATVLPTGESLDNLDFSYEVKVHGHNLDWRPVRVYTNGNKTFIEFPPAVSHGDLPALVALDGKTDALVNYRFSSDRFVVDKLLRHAALIRGVGSQQQRVELIYTGKL